MNVRVFLGAGLWLFALVAALSLLGTTEAGEGWSKLWRFATQRAQTVKVHIPADEPVQPGERVLGLVDGRLGLVGRVELVAPYAVDPASVTSRTVTLAFDPETAPVTTAATFRVINARGDMTWAIKTILPDHKLEKIKTELQRFRAAHEEELIDLARIVGKEVSREAIDVLNENLSQSVKRHEKEWRAVLDKHREGLKRDLLPVLKDRLGPTVKTRLKPVLTKIGKELWDQLPVWSVTWRSVADKIPGVRQRYMEKWWSDFLENKAIPIVKAHESEFIALAEDLMIKATEDPAVRGRMAVIARRMVDDPAFRELVNVVLREALIDPFEGEAFIKRLMAKEEVRVRFELLTEQFKPTLQRITRIIVESEEGGLNPELVEVVRRVFFERQARAIILVRGRAEGAAPADPGEAFSAEVLRPRPQGKGSF